MEKKQRTTIWLSQNVMNELDQMSERADCRSRSEFIEKAIKFYDGYIRSADENQYLPIALSSAMNGIIHTSEDRIAKVLYKNTVELSMLMNILAAPEGIACIQKDHPDVDIYCGAVDDHLNEHGYIVPGLGDAGDRIFGTK